MRRIHRAALSALLAASAAFAVRAQTGPAPAEMLDRHARALGGREAISRVRSVVSSGELVLLPGGMRGEVRSWSARPCRSRTEARLGIFTVRQGFDGERSWMVGPNGMLQIMRDEDSRRSQVTACLLESFAYLEPGGPFEVEDLGEAIDDSARCAVIGLSPDGGYPCRIFLDRLTWLVRKIEIDAFAGTVEQRFDDYRETAGVLFPRSIATTQGSIGQTMAVTVLELEVNAGIDPAIFLPPGEAADDFRFTGRGGDPAGSAAADAAENIPFDYRGGHIYLKVEVAGREVPFLLDSGAGMTMIDPAIADTLALTRDGAIPGAGAGGMTEFEMTRLPGFAIEGIEFDTQTVAVFPVSGLTGRFSGIAAGGILGYDFLSRFLTRIDYRRRMISFYRPGSGRPPDGAGSLQAPLVHRIFSLPASVDGVEGIFLIDTGANASILQKRFADEHRLLEGRPSIELAVAGAGGDDLAVAARLDSLRFGGIMLRGPVFTIPQGGRGIGAFEGIAGIIGNDILERFDVWLDYAGQRIVVEGGGSPERPFWPDRSGMLLAAGPGGAVGVAFVVPGAPAAEA
ncbi:MAG: aspartyl protease family protein, partial [Candidatus Krumholzibacteria bacterium]|nr:aspartyl protease family protein [Candidatus Krumholzibacteria bacterium]